MEGDKSLNGTEEFIYDPPPELLKYLENPVPRPADARIRDAFLEHYKHSGEFLFKCGSKFLYLLAFGIFGFTLWVFFFSRDPRYSYDVLTNTLKDNLLQNWLPPFAGFIACFWLLAKVSSWKARRASLLDLLTNGTLTSGRIVDVEEVQHGRYGTAYMTVFEYLGYDGKTTAGKYTTFIQSVGQTFRNYQRLQLRILVLFKPGDPTNTVPLLSREKEPKRPPYGVYW